MISLKKKANQIIFLLSLGLILGFILGISSFSLWYSIKSQEKISTEKSINQLYIEKYIKAKGVAEHFFSENSFIRIELKDLERRQYYDFASSKYQPRYWLLNYSITNLSEEPCQVYYQPQLDYLINGVWYECNSYGIGFLIEKDEPFATLSPKESISCQVRIETPMSPDNTLPFYSGHFWYGHYRLVVNYNEENSTYVEFDIPETELYSWETLYKNYN